MVRAFCKDDMSETQLDSAPQNMKGIKRVEGEDGRKAKRGEGKD